MTTATVAPSTATLPTPGYYTLPPGLDQCHDLTDLLVLRYGPQRVFYHLLMEQEQYVWRSLMKGTFSADQQKIAQLAARAQTLARAYPDIQQQPGEPGMPLAVAIEVLQRHGYGIIAPPRGPTARRPVGDLPATPEPWEETLPAQAADWTREDDLAPAITSPVVDPAISLAGCTILQAAQQYWYATHGVPWTEEERRRCEALLTSKSWVHSLGYDEHRVALSRDHELVPYFPLMEGFRQTLPYVLASVDPSGRGPRG